MMPFVLGAWLDNPQLDRWVEPLCLLFAACTCLCVIRLRWHRRTAGRNDHLAQTLAGALRGGALEFDDRPRDATSLWCPPVEPEADEEPEAATPRNPLIPSRYHVLGYGSRVYEPPELAVQLSVETTVFGISEPQGLRPDGDLLEGIPLIWLRPESGRGLQSH